MPADEQHGEVDLKNASQIFNVVMVDLERRYERENLRFPKEILWLGGAPGAGKGTNTEAIMDMRSIDAPPITMSELLDTPEMRALKDAGQLVGDREVVGILLQELLKPVYKNGVVVDGFPRTTVQSEIVKMLYRMMVDLRREFFETPVGPEFRNPIFRLCVLHVPEEVAVERQLHRGREVLKENEELRRQGLLDQITAVRATDTSPELCRERYRVFKEQTLPALDNLRDTFVYHFIDATGEIPRVQANIQHEFAYQSERELANDTADSIRNVPLASSLLNHARQQLVRRLDNYRHRHAELFTKVIATLERDVVPVIKRHAFAGHALAHSDDPIFESSEALDMAVDVLCERGFRPTIERQEQIIPVRVDPQTNAIVTAVRRSWVIEISFPPPQIRR